MATTVDLPCLSAETVHKIQADVERLQNELKHSQHDNYVCWDYVAGGDGSLEQRVKKLHEQMQELEKRVALLEYWNKRLMLRRYLLALMEK